MMELFSIYGWSVITVKLTTGSLLESKFTAHFECSNAVLNKDRPNAKFNF
jgi:hypothetical protein